MDYIHFGETETRESGVPFEVEGILYRYNDNKERVREEVISNDECCGIKVLCYVLKVVVNGELPDSL